jgi:hypothetical protein
LSTNRNNIPPLRSTNAASGRGDKHNNWGGTFPLDVLYQLKMCWLLSSLFCIGFLLFLLVLWRTILTFIIWFYVRFHCKAAQIPTY